MSLAIPYWLVVLATGLLPLLAYYLIVWYFVGRDPKRSPTTVVQYEPPEGLSPAAVRYVSTLRCDGRTLAAAIVDLAVRGKLWMYDSGPEYFLKRTGDAPLTSDLPGEEKVLIQQLFASRAAVEVVKEEWEVFLPAIREFKTMLSRLYAKGKYFSSNWGFSAAGILFTVMLLVGLVNQLSKPGFFEPLTLGDIANFISRSPAGARFIAFVSNGDIPYSRFSETDAFPLGLFTLIFLLGSLALYGGILRLGYWKRGRPDQDSGGGTGAVAITILGLLLTIFGLVPAMAISMTYAIFLVGATWLNLVFLRLLPSYTKSGRRLLEKIEGFRQYLATVEQDPLNRLSLADKVQGTLVGLLPYALALDVRHDWTDSFSMAVQCVDAEARKFLMPLAK